MPEATCPLRSLAASYSDKWLGGGRNDVWRRDSRPMGGLHSRAPRTVSRIPSDESAKRGVGAFAQTSFRPKRKTERRTLNHLRGFGRCAALNIDCSVPSGIVALPWCGTGTACRETSLYQMACDPFIRRKTYPLADRIASTSLAVSGFMRMPASVSYHDGARTT